MPSEINEDNIEEVCEEWMGLQATLKRIKEDEMTMRKDIVAYLVPKGEIGLHTQGFAGIIAKATLKLNYKFDEMILDELYEDMSEAEKDAVRYKPSLSLSQYKKIAEANREKLDETLIVTPAAPTLNVQYRKPEEME